MSYKDRTFCAAKCVNALCSDNRIHTAGAPKDSLVSWADYSDKCVSFEATDTIFIGRMPIEALMEKANKAAGLSWELGEAFHELAFKVVDRIGEVNSRKLTEEQRNGFESIMDRLRLKKSGLPWVEGNG